ncbi:hypothetical protein L9F63_002080, partial [Diploptera punctata]
AINPVLGNEVIEGAVTGRSVQVACNSSREVFHCDKTSCISTPSLCNGIPDCHDGRDETVAQC